MHTNIGDRYHDTVMLVGLSVPFWRRSRIEMRPLDTREEVLLPGVSNPEALDLANHVVPKYSNDRRKLKTN
jgi:hypothetical protein